MIRIQVSLTNEQYQALKAAAEGAGLGTSALLRRLVTEGLAVPRERALEPPLPTAEERRDEAETRRPTARRRRGS
ncbi:MAG TPA: hypothetical protein VF017_17060 [Thermoanaerobaculia bacterium]|nr:hypothetical protein [Thermoanaerobaculia bacterium]